MGVCSGVTRSMHKTQCVHFPDLFSLWGGVESPPPPSNTQTKQNVHTQLQNPGYATARAHMCVCVLYHHCDLNCVYLCECLDQ